MAHDKVAPLINLDECNSIVNKFNQETENNLRVKSFQIVLAAEAKGFLGEYFHLEMRCTKQYNEAELNTLDVGSDAVLLKFFIKKLPPVEEHHEKVRIFRKESSLYASLLPALRKYSTEPWSPKIYLCYKNLLVLEDLVHQGFYALTSKETLTESEMFPVLNGLAAMHASSLLYEFETKVCIEDLYHESLKEITVDLDVPWFRTGLKAIFGVAKSHPKYQGEESQQFVASVLPQCLENVCFMVNPSQKYRNVFCHRDTWGGNIFLNHLNHQKPALFVDFQTCRYSPAAIDVIFTLFINLTKRERIEKQTQYIKFYYRQLLQHVTKYVSSDKFLGEIAFSEAELVASIEEFKLFGLVYRALAVTVLQVPKEFVTDYYKNEERSEKLLEYMRENVEFCHVMNESVEDIIQEIAKNSIKILNK